MKYEKTTSVGIACLLTIKIKAFGYLIVHSLFLNQQLLLLRLNRICVLLEPRWNVKEGISYNIYTIMCAWKHKTGGHIYPFCVLT